MAVLKAIALVSLYRPLSHSGHFESQENKKLCFCTASLALDERLAVQNLLLQHRVIKVYSDEEEKPLERYKTRVKVAEENKLFSSF